MKFFSKRLAGLARGNSAENARVALGYFNLRVFRSICRISRGSVLAHSERIFFNVETEAGESSHAIRFDYVIPILFTLFYD